MRGAGCEVQITGNEGIEGGGQKVDYNEKLLLSLGAVLYSDSSYLAGPVFDRSDIIYGVIEPQRMTEGRLAIDTNGHYSRPDVFQLEVNASPQSGISFTAARK